MTIDYLFMLSEMKRHPNADLADLRLSDGVIDLLKSGRIKALQFSDIFYHKRFILEKVLSNFFCHKQNMSTIHEPVFSIKAGCRCISVGG